jgi:peptide deformylase
VTPLPLTCLVRPATAEPGKGGWYVGNVSGYALRFFGDPVLKQPARLVEELTADLVPLVHGMYETMDAAEGIGLAAPQVGVRKRLFTYDLHEGDGPHVVLNPEIVERSGEVLLDEGCLSVPGFRFGILRAERLTMRGMDLDGHEVVLDADGLLAHVIQHEVDHLDGVLLLDRLEPEERREALRAIRLGEVPAGSVPERQAGSVPERQAGSVPERQAADQG